MELLNVLLVAILLLFISEVRSNSDEEAQSFCSKGNAGTYCRHDYSGYYWCFSADWSPLSTFQQCPDGTYCGCFSGPDCETVQTIGNGSPCIARDPATSLPYYPDQLTITKTVTTTVVYPTGRYIRTTNEVDYWDATSHLYRSDRNISFSAYGQTQYLQDFWNERGHYHYDALHETCSADIAPIPFNGVPRYPQTPKQYQFLRSDIYKGENVEVFYFRKGGHYSPDPTVYAEIWISMPDANGRVIPVQEIYNTIGATSLSTSEYSVTVYSNAIIGQPSSSVFTVPDICPQLYE